MLFEHILLWERLKALPPPGNHLQEPLRWIDGVPAHSVPIKRCIFLTSLLPPEEECYVKVRGRKVGPSQRASLLLMILYKWISMDFCGYLLPNSSFFSPGISSADWAAMIAMIDVRRCSRLLHWVSVPGKIYRLQQVLALVEEIQSHVNEYTFRDSRFYSLRLITGFCAWVTLLSMTTVS